MVFTRPPADDAFRQAMLQPKKYAKTKRGKAEKERDRWAALTPEQQSAVEALTRSLTAKLLHPQLTALRKKSEEYR